VDELCSELVDDTGVSLETVIVEVVVEVIVVVVVVVVEEEWVLLVVVVVVVVDEGGVADEVECVSVEVGVLCGAEDSGGTFD